MDYEDLVDDQPEDPAPDPAPEPVEVEPPVKRGASWKAVILTGLLAGLVGTGGGAAAVYFGLKNQTPDTPTFDAQALRTELQQAMSSQMTAFDTRLSSAEAKIKQTANRPAPELSPVDFSPLEARLSDLEASAQTEIAPETLTALKAATEDGFQWPDVSELEDRLAALENQTETSSDVMPDMMLAMADRIDALEAMDRTAPVAEGSDTLMTRLEALENRSLTVSTPDIPDNLMARIEALENRPVVKTQTETEIVPVLAFPKAALIKAVEETTEGGFMSRTLSKHIRVKDEDDPRTLIDGISNDITEGRLDLAMNKYERLPEPVRTAGQAWYNSVKQANIKAAQ
ncbi:hypothetical protein [Litorimonas sp. WD9-15]|uniref:hypothetical protein n=1 Tax=Litorimonas sp. WD9-15 TaxID=3418716 RepID=UPI003CFEF0DF